MTVPEDKLMERFIFLPQGIGLRFDSWPGNSGDSLLAELAMEKRERSSVGIDSKESIPPAWRACTSNRLVVPARQAGNRFLSGLLKNVYTFGLSRKEN